MEEPPAQRWQGSPMGAGGRLYHPSEVAAPVRSQHELPGPGTAARLLLPPRAPEPGSEPSVRPPCPALPIPLPSKRCWCGWFLPNPNNWQHPRPFLTFPASPPPVQHCRAPRYVPSSQRRTFTRSPPPPRVSCPSTLSQRTASVLQPPPTGCSCSDSSRSPGHHTGWAPGDPGFAGCLCPGTSCSPAPQG